MKFRKKNPNPFAFAPLPLDVYELTGTVEHKPLATAILSRLLSGVVYRK